MDLVITGRHMTVSRELQEHVETRIGRLERLGQRLTRAHVVLEADGDRLQVEITVAALRGLRFSAHTVADRWETAVNRAAEKLDRQVKRFKERLHDRRALAR